jgi:hypothetical protein
LLKSSEKKVFMILDNLRVHHAKVFQAWLAELNAEIEIFYLPYYSPELNPDEYLNCDLKEGFIAVNQQEAKINSRAKSFHI